LKKLYRLPLKSPYQRVGYISGLASNGKIPIGQAFQEIEVISPELQRTKKQLGAGEHP
jgi:hypothetical protein